jgi:hypothetical protein
MPNAEGPEGAQYSAFSFCHLPFAIGSRAKRASGKWAHQDSNLERAGYEPAALTIELWARLNGTPNLPPSLQPPTSNLQ